MKRVLLALALAGCATPAETGPYVRTVIPTGNGLIVERCTLIVGETGLREGTCTKKLVPLSSVAPSR